MIKELYFVQVKCQKQLLEKKSEKFSFMSLDRSRIPFDWSNRNRESIESSRDFVMNFFNFSIDREFLLIDQMFLFRNFEMDLLNILINQEITSTDRIGIEK